MKTLRANFDNSYQAINALSDIKKLNIKIESATIKLEDHSSTEQRSDYNLLGLGLLNTPSSFTTKFSGAPAGVIANTVLTNEKEAVPANMSILTNDSYVHQLLPILEDHGVTNYTVS